MKIELSGLQKVIFEERYAHTGETSWDDLSKRVATHVAQTEHEEYRDEWEKRFRKIISDGLFVPGGRILYGSGRNRAQLLNCFLLDVEDSRESIGQLFNDFFVVSGTGGGVGINFSKLRPRGARLSGIGGSASGPVSFMEAVDKLATTVKAGGSRRAALLFSLDARHPDILEFLEVKLDKGKLNNANISIAFGQDFIDAVKEDEDWELEFNGKKYSIYIIEKTEDGGDTQILEVPATDEELANDICKAYYKEFGKDHSFRVTGTKNLKARYIWDRCIENQLKVGDPGFMNLGFMNEMSNTYYFSEIRGTNPCGEIPLGKNQCCCLGAINLSNLVVVNEDGTTSFSWTKFKHTIHQSVRFLDDVLDVNQYPLQTIREECVTSRRIGLGVMGLHHALVKLGYTYGDDDCLEFVDRLFMRLRDESYVASSEIAKEKGSFPRYNRQMYLRSEFVKSLPTRVKNRIKKHGIRNCVVNTVAPTGTTSMVLGTSSGIEPIFAPAYRRKYYSGQNLEEETVIDPLVVEMHKEGRKVDHIRGALDITPEQHIAVQQTVQKYIDSSLSKTINLPEDFKDEELSELLLDNVEELKGTTIYRVGSKGEEPLHPVKITNDLLKQELKEETGPVTCRLGEGKCDA